jgi:5-methylcytosine-specific restriction endonuclease McrA
MARTLGTTPNCRMAGAGLNAGKRTANPRGMTQKSKQAVYQDPRWRRLRKIVLANFPLCVCGCGGAAEILDHIIPIQQPAGLMKAFSADAVQGLTRVCHSRKNERIDAPGADVTRYRHDRAHEADMRPQAMKDWARWFVDSGEQLRRVGDPAGGKGTSARRQWVGDVCC